MEIKDLISTFNEDQYNMFSILEKEDLYQFRVPTGVGKGYVSIVHILNRIMNSDDKNFLIASHRLSLNNQHLRDFLEFSIKVGLSGKISFLTIGSDSLDIDKTLKKMPKDLRYKFHKDRMLLKKSGKDISKNSLFKQSLSYKECTKFIEKNNNNGRKCVIISTYNSLDKARDIDLDIAYFDEAHILASIENESEFRLNFEKIKPNKKFFFSATPKDLVSEILKTANKDEKLNYFLMNNEDIFGKAYNLSYREAIEKSYITNVITHIAKPSNLKYTENFEGVYNKALFIKDTFKAHRKWLNKISNIPEEIAPKMLVKCDSVSSMWRICKELRKIMPEEISICAGASKGSIEYDEVPVEEREYAKHVIDDIEYKNRDEFLKTIQDFDNTKECVILHFDILSEGVNVSGITSVMFLTGVKPPSLAKTIQTIGRATRLHRKDRMDIRDGVLNSKNYHKWIKSHCAVIIPYWDAVTEMTKNFIAHRIRDLKNEYGFESRFVLSVGDDVAEGYEMEEMEGLNRKDPRNNNYDLIKDIKNIIEKLDIDDKKLLEDKRIKKMSKLELLKEKFK